MVVALLPGFLTLPRFYMVPVHSGIHLQHDSYLDASLGRSEGSLQQALGPKYDLLRVKRPGRGLGGKDAASEEGAHEPSPLHAPKQRSLAVLAPVPKQSRQVLVEGFLLTTEGFN